MTTGGELFAIGVVSRAHGIKGEFILTPLTSFLERFLDMDCAMLGRNHASYEEYIIEKASVDRKAIRMKLKEVNDRTSAEALVGSYMFVTETERVRLPKDEFFTADLIGCIVYDEKANRIGVLTDVLKMPGHDIFVLDCDGREAMVPAVKEFIRAVDPVRRSISVRLIDGLVG